MFFYSFILVLVFLIGLLAQKYKKNNKAHLGFAILIIVILTLVSGLRYNVGTDYVGYTHIYNLNSVKNLTDIITGTEPLFNLITWLLSRSTYEPQRMFFIVAAATISFSVLGIRKYSVNFSFSIFLYLTAFAYFSSMNGIRQWLAVSILFYFLDLIIHEKKIKFLMVAFVAGMIHSSAILFIPVFFIVNKKHTTGLVTFLFVSAIVLLVSYPLLEAPLANLLGEKYGNYLISTTGYGSEGVNILRIIVPTIIYVTSLFYIKKNDVDKLTNVILNLILLGVLISFLGIYSKIFFRMTTYFSVYEMLIIPIFFEKVKKREKLLVGFVLVVIFYTYVNVLWNIDSNVLPYQTIFYKNN